MLWKCRFFPSRTGSIYFEDHFTKQQKLRKQEQLQPAHDQTQALHIDAGKNIWLAGHGAGTEWWASTAWSNWSELILQFHRIIFGADTHIQEWVPERERILEYGYLLEKWSGKNVKLIMIS